MTEEPCGCRVAGAFLIIEADCKLHNPSLCQEWKPGRSAVMCELPAGHPSSEPHQGRTPRGYWKSWQ